MFTVLERRFGPTARGSSVRTEVLAGATTFLTMAYIVVVNPAILGQAGMPVAAVAIATCLAAGLASILMGLVANLPLALAPGMGINAYFAFTVVLGMRVPWRIALGCVFLSGLLFLLLTLTGLRRRIVEAMPPHLLAAIAGGIGLFIAFIGLRDAGLIASSPATAVTLGSLRAPGALLALLGLLLTAALLAWRVRGAILIGIVGVTILAALLGQIAAPVPSPGLAALRQTAFQLDLGGVFGTAGRAGLGVLEILFVFLFVDLFDNVGTLVGVTRRIGLMDPRGRIVGIDRILMVDAVASIFGALVGTSTVTSYIESAAGVEVGGRTGLTAIVTGCLFLIAMLFAPLAQLVPAAATAPALILVGSLMMAPLAAVAWDDPLDAIPAFLTLLLIPLTYSIANGLAFGLTAHVALRALRGRLARGDALLVVLALLCVARFAWMAAG